MKYSLADYTVAIKFNDPQLQADLGAISIGGEGKYTDSISASYTNNQWQTDTFATGGWVHNKNLSRAGAVSITLSQLSEQVSKFKQICNNYYSKDYSGMTITISDNSLNPVCICEDCYIEQIPEQSFASAAGRQTWRFVAGNIVFY